MDGNAAVRDGVTREELEKLPTADLQAMLARLEWEKRRHKHQVEPGGAWWAIWLLRAGRGAGKSRAAAEEAWWYAYRNPGTRQLVAAPTSDDLRSICFEGESGLVKVCPPSLIKDYNKSLHEMIIRTQGGGPDSLIRGIPASEPNRFRGPEWHRAWLEELAAWQYDKEAFDMIMFSLRLGKQPRLMITSTPKPKPLIRDLVKRSGKDVVDVVASSDSNFANLAPTFKDQLMRYSGTVLERQERFAELLDPEEQGIVKRSSIRMWLASKPLPWFDYIVMSLDTALTEETRDKDTGDPDYTACQVWGLFQHEKRANAMLLDAWQARLGFPELIKRVKDELKSEYGQMETPILRPLIGPAQVALEVKKIDLLLIEDIGSGKSLRQVLASQDIQAFAYNPGRAKKLDRLHAVSHLFAGGASGVGVVWMTEGRRREKDGTYSHTGDFSSWAQQVVDQLCTFSGEGSIPHDDHVDACVTGETPIFTPNGLRLISEIKVGDEVLTHKGNWRRVTATMTRQADDVYCLQSKTLDSVNITGTHSVFASYIRYQNAAHRFGETPRFIHTSALKVRPTYKIQRKGKTITSVQASTHDAVILPCVKGAVETQIISASSRWQPNQIILRDGLISMRTKSHFVCNDMVNLNYDTGFVFGLYFSEGNLFRDDGVQFSCDKRTLEHVRDIFVREFGASPAPIRKGDGCHAMIFHRMAWVPWFRDFGMGALNKTIPQWTFDAPKEFIHGILDGIVVGDGHYRASTDQCTITSISLSGLWMLRLLLLKISQHGTICVSKGAGKRMIFGKERHCQTAYALCLYPSQRKAGSVCWVNGDAAFYVESLIKKPGKYVVFNLSVEGDESYVTTAGAFHNCTQALRLLSDRNMLDLVRNVPDGRVPEARPSRDVPPNPYAA